MTVRERVTMTGLLGRVRELERELEREQANSRNLAGKPRSARVDAYVDHLEKQRQRDRKRTRDQWLRAELWRHRAMERGNRAA